MKYKFLLVVPFIIIAGFSCKKKPKTPYDVAKKDNTGNATVLINGKLWVGNVNAAARDNRPGRVIISLSLYIDGILRQDLSITGINPGIADQKIYATLIPVGSSYKPRTGDSCLASFHLEQDDASENYYNILESSTVDNTVHIDSYEQAKAKIKGSFQMTLYRMNTDFLPQSQGYPDTLRITNGSFDLGIVN